MTEASSSSCPRCESTLPPGDGPCPACGAMRVAAGAQVLDGKWVLDRVLGKGGMGTVWLAHDIDLERKVAVKMLAANLAADAEVRARFEREARMMGRLDHPNLVPVFAVGRRKGAPFIVMKLLEGQTLYDLLAQRGKLEPGEVLPLVRQLCAGLQFMHQRDVVHRDIKPANVFVAPDGHVTLLDLGVARDSQSTMTSAGTMVGTPRYMAPEQVVGKRVDHRTDLYALAALTWELITNKPVFEGESDHSVLKAHLASPPPDGARVAGLAPALAAVFARGLAKKPEERFQSASEFLAALEAAVPASAPGPLPGIPLDTVPSMKSPLAPAPLPPPVPDEPPLPTGVVGVAGGKQTRRARGPLLLEDDDEATDAVTEDHHALGPGPKETLEKTRELVPLPASATLDEERTNTARPPLPTPAAEAERPTRPETPVARASESSESLGPIASADKTEERAPLTTGWYFMMGGKLHHVGSRALIAGVAAVIVVIALLVVVLS